LTSVTGSSFFGNMYIFFFCGGIKLSSLIYVYWYVKFIDKLAWISSPLSFFLWIGGAHLFFKAFSGLVETERSHISFKMSLKCLCFTKF
jgi:hypothetical protein